MPEKYKGKFKKGPLENSESIQYADYALKQFFIEATKQSWYNNTFFILVADHASLSDHRFFKNVVGNQSIPILFFKPDNSLAGKNKAVMNQMDILPSALNMMGYNKPFFALGRSFLDTVARKSYFYANIVNIMFISSTDKLSIKFSYIIMNFYSICHFITYNKISLLILSIDTPINDYFIIIFFC